MAEKIILDHGTTGRTLYAYILNSSGYIWNGTTFVVIATADWATYDIAMTEQGTTGIYEGDFPAIAAGTYGIGVCWRIGGAPATTDPLVGYSSQYWDGTGSAVVLATKVNRLFDAILRLARELLLMRDGTATAGTTVSLTDTNSPAPIDTFTGGTIFLMAQKVSQVITTHATTVFSFPGVVTAPVSGDHYAVADGDIPRSMLISAINEALRTIVLAAEDATTVVVADQEEYTLPTGVAGVYKVELASSLTAPYHYKTLYHWDEIDGKLRFAQGYPPPIAGYALRLTYRYIHADLEDDDDLIPAVDMNLLHWTAVQAAAKYGQHVHNNDPKRDWNGKLQEAEVRIQRLMSHQPPPRKTVRLADW